MKRRTNILALVPLLPALAQAPRIEIHILEGNNVINYLNQRTAQEPIVQVEDENHRPVAGAAILFRLPEKGPSAHFLNGSRDLMVVTDENGRAGAHGLTADGGPGPFQISVTATYGAVIARAVIRETNVKPVATESAGHGISPIKFWVIAGAIGGAIAAGAIVAGGGSHGTSAASATATSAVPGGTIVGPPR